MKWTKFFLKWSAIVALIMAGFTYGGRLISSQSDLGVAAGIGLLAVTLGGVFTLLTKYRII